MSYTWEELREEYSTENYPPFGGPFTDALDPWEWLSKNFDPPKRSEETKIKVTVKKDSEMAKMVDTMKAEKQDFKNRVESGEFSGSDKKETAVDWLEKELKERYPLMNSEPFFEQAKKMEEEQILNELKLIGSYFDVSKLDVKEISHHIRFTSIIQDRINHYNETYGK